MSNIYYREEKDSVFKNIVLFYQFFMECFWPFLKPSVTVKPVYDQFLRKHKGLFKVNNYVMKNKAKITIGVLLTLTTVLLALLLYTPEAMSDEKKSKNVLLSKEEVQSIIKAETEHYQKEVQTLKSQNEKVIEQFNELDRVSGMVIDQYEKENASLTKANEELENTIKLLEAKVKDLEQKNATLTAEIKSKELKQKETKQVVKTPVVKKKVSVNNNIDSFFDELEDL